MSIKQEIMLYTFLQGYGERLLEGLDAEQAFKPICEGGNHPAWIIGHLAFVGQSALSLIGGTPTVDVKRYESLFGGGTKAQADPSAYPTWDELLAAWRDAHAAVVKAGETVTNATLDAENPIEHFRKALPTTRDFLGFLFTGHEGLHLGQLSTWRRTQGQPPLF